MFAGTPKHLILVLGLFLALMAGCGPGLPDHVRQKAEAVPKAIESMEKAVEKDKGKFARLKASPEFAPLERFAQKENWENRFEKALASLDRARDLYQKELDPLVRQDRPELSKDVLTQTDRISGIIKEAGLESKYPAKRFARLGDAVKGMAQIRETALTQAHQITAMTENIEKTVVPKAQKEFPDAANKIHEKFSALGSMGRKTLERQKVLEREYRLHKSGKPADYALFIDSTDGISRDFEKASSLEKEFRAKIGQLSQSYTKVLQDMKQEYHVIVARESWDESSDFSTPRTVTFQRQVSLETFEALNQSEMESIASILPGYAGMHLKNRMGQAWTALNIHPTEQWPDRNHNAAEFWIQRTFGAYFHKYLLENNGETKETDWEKVNPSFFEQHYEHLGMAIVSKPFGVFEEDRLTQAAPPGMAYVGNPQYGQWQKDDKGDSFWAWYGRYALFSNLFFFPPSFFYYNSWNNWNRHYRHTKPYYGVSKNGIRQYGTFGRQVKNSPKYQRSSFARAGGFKAASPSVRGAGSRFRGGGPGGKGK